ncbi:Mrp/NBP35 family ATP-binding protein [Robiginitomaculum antarcticum]|uniref:Mrp/NBP35 family ATP-binding protein n=1 Tax=Robiginitomaculum antarcticum TaxID=437507 RepID=UPI000362E6E0|nr:P-loop NTPase [Robiginitomaculum antarcticum]
MAITEDQALRELSTIRVPNGSRDIVAAGRLSDLQFGDGSVTAVLSIDPSEAQIFAAVQKAAQAALAALDPAITARVVLTAHKAAPSPKSAAPKNGRNPHQARRPEGYQGDSQIDKIIAISSAKGGVGKSTVAVNLAAALAKSGKRVGILDADIHGPSIARLLGLFGARAGTAEVQGRRLIAPQTAHGLKAMSIAFLTEDDGPIVWRGPMVQGAISRMLWDTDWGELDYLFIDMPPGTGDAQLGLAQDIKPAAAVIVTTPQDLALADARKGAAMFGKVDIRLAGLIENMNQFVCSNCGAVHDIFGQSAGQAEAAALGIPYLGSAPLSIDVRKSCDFGVPIALGESAEAKLFAALAEDLIARI